jgi:BirA family biotin operon repressor/biotin-[acetyl-CoA-carboxylase] ligase
MDVEAPVPADLAAAWQQHAARLGAFGRTPRYFEQAGSTNDIAAGLAAGGAEEGTTVVAAAQTAGRGRRGRAWYSPPGAGLYVSVVLRPTHAGSRAGAAPLLTLASGVALAEAVRVATGLPVEIKWPNDLVIGRPPRKLAGILAEASTAEGRLDHVVLGFGINLREAGFPEALAGRATSLERELGRPVDGASVLVESLAALASCYGELLQGRLAAILDRCRALAPGSRGETVEWDTAQGPRRGVTEGIDDEGALIVRVGPALERIVAGEVRWL